MRVLLLLIPFVEARMICDKTYMPFEIGLWKPSLKQMDSVVIENPANSAIEGQTYVYENYFPDYTISYIHVYNLAVKTCGATPSLKSGGIGNSAILIVLHSDIHQEIRSVIDVWGKRKPNCTKNTTLHSKEFKNMKSMYLFKDLRAVSHNLGFHKLS